MRRVVLVVSLVLVGCRDRLPAVVVAPPPLPEPPAELWAPPAFGDTITSLRAKKSTTVRSEPNEKSAPLGVLAQDMRVTWRGARAGPGCDRWIQIDPGGWVCDAVLAPTKQPPFSAELPKLQPGAIVPGIYGVPIGRAKKDRELLESNIGNLRQFGSLAVLLKFRDEVKVGRRTFLRTRLGQLVDVRQVRVREPSMFAGIDLKAPETPILPLAWARSRTAPKGPIGVWSAPEDGELIGMLEPRAMVPVLGRSEDNLWVSVGPDVWISADDLLVAERVEPPAEVGANEPWVDVDLSQQVLVAYEGRRPVFTTLVSTGTAHPTPLGTYRIWIKFSEADMQGDTGDHRYAVSSVPWTMYFHKDFALHAAYWHDGFGSPRSNGCVNLAPQDARWLYQWTWPSVPEGWSMSYSTSEVKGSLVQIRKSVSSFNEAVVRRPAALRRVPANALAARTAR